MNKLIGLSLLFITSCSEQEMREQTTNQKEEIVEQDKTVSIDVAKSSLTFEELQDSLRLQLLKSKPNNNLKAGFLQEFYIRGLVRQEGNKIVFELPFDLHSFDCGAPDCYLTDITFSIPATEPISFPQKVEFSLSEYGCGIDQETSINGIFERVESTSNYVNYYTKETKSNLAIDGNTRQVYYFTDVEPNSTKVDSIDKILERYNEEDPNAIVPYRSTVMTSNEYERFLKTE
ncbi:hypothetical protein V6R21_21110 [Limibacter armeniacum]|uniref:hypothetical protein n=1 Tax=Limibacter armeniacum TaxID=466084 RepID=UPI002FE5B469